MISAKDMAHIARALPFWVSLLFVPLIAIAAVNGGWWIAIVPLYAWAGFTILDTLTDLNQENADPETPRKALTWYRLITLIWGPIQFCILFAVIYYGTRADHLSTRELIALLGGVGLITGAIGINYAHELMHQRSRLERWMADLLLAMVLYSHFRSEHLLVHHRYVGTPRDPVTARYNENFFHYFIRVLWHCPQSAFKAEASMLARKNRPWYDRSNPFWRYILLQTTMLGLSMLLGGFLGLVLFIFQAFVAILFLELVNYVEHYGLTRRHIRDGKYEPVRPHHSWNAAHRGTNWLLINLQRHSDHHYKPDRPFPLLQTYDEKTAPQLPFGYPLMTALAIIPPLWRRVMNPKVRAWRKYHYPDIEDWTPYKTGTTPMPR